MPEYHLQFDALCKQCHLGNLIASPKALPGGHMHKVFQLHTETGTYAVKALNPGVMARPEAMQNLTNAEHIAQVAAKHIPALPALKLAQAYMQEIEGQYYYVFPWITGETLQDAAVTTAHSATMGNLLAQLHGIDFSALGLADSDSFREVEINWEWYLQKGKESKQPWAKLFSKNLQKLYDWNGKRMQAAGVLSKGTVISHGDLEPKNVMWQDRQPLIIDWESAGFIHPAYDLFESAGYWARDRRGRIQKTRFLAFICAYRKVRPNLQMDYDAVLDKGFTRLGWLEYSCKRSLGIACADAAERAMGTAHVSWAIRDLQRYEAMIPVFKEWMMEVI